ncbi:MAG: family 43 glycosylhydrolase [Bacteroidales bacterium]|nr:family 43 glycosylhydrolase [Bacteroidales bacterium]
MKMKMIRIVLAAVLLPVIKNATAIEITGSVFSHDPATITREGDTYWHFYTAPGIGAAYSSNLTSWISTSNHIFTPGTDWKSHYPAWTLPYFGSGTSANTDGNLWAPDVIFMNGAYYLYYSCSSFGSSYSAIGVVKSSSLNSPVWVDMGMVVSSDGSSTAINAIDPGLFRDNDGKIYMVYGSWFGGIGIVEIDSITGLAVSSVTHLYGGSHQSIEAPYLFKEGDYYYLVVNRGNCCQGVNSTYYITVGRSANVTGPYEGWQTILQTEGRYIGPGHFGLLRKNGFNYVSIHYYDKNANGYPKLDILKMTMEDGWPVLTRNFDLLESTGIEFEIKADETTNDPIVVYPNPADEVGFMLEFPGFKNNEPVSVRIFNPVGKLIYTREFDKPKIIQINNNFDKGVYMIHIRTGHETFIRKVFIQ